MKFFTPKPVTDIANTYKAKLIGDPENLAIGMNEIHRVSKGDITFVDVEKYYDKSLKSDATIILIDKEVPCPPGKTLLVVENPFRVFTDLAMKERMPVPARNDIHPSAKIHPTSIIEPHVVIRENVTIGADTYIQSFCYIGPYTEIGNGVKIMSNNQIGNDAFYFKKEQEAYQAWHSVGSVSIEDDVFLGPGCTINRGVTSQTIIGKGSKLDAQVHVGHGAIIGENSLIAAQVGIAGKTRIGRNAIILGQVGISQNLEIGENVTILAKSGVSKNLDSDKTYFGYPANEVTKVNRELAWLRMNAHSHTLK